MLMTFLDMFDVNSKLHLTEANVKLHVVPPMKRLLDLKTNDINYKQIQYVRLYILNMARWRLMIEYSINDINVWIHEYVC